MIISASRRTDIPAFHSQWLFHRLKAGFCLVSHSGKSRKLYRVPLSPEVVDCIAFRTKNPAPMLDQLHLLEDYPYFFNITMNPYGRAMETRLPSLPDRVSVFKELARRVGSLRMVWRYDPVMLSPQYDLDFHRRAFTYLCRELQGKAYKCMIGFIIHHPFVAKRIDPLAVERRSRDRIRLVGEMFAGIARRYGVPVETCAEETDLSEFGIKHGACIEREQLERICGYRFAKVKEKYLRPFCNCMESVDIGHYSTCDNGCLYCYATPARANMNTDPMSPSLDPGFGSLPMDRFEIIDLRGESHRNLQRELF